MSQYPTYSPARIRQDKYSGVPLTVAPVPRWGFYSGLDIDVDHSGIFSKRAALRVKAQLSPKQEKGNRPPRTAW